ncbi:hypothetical protein N4R57_17675 [Rhodobacteraceae bacterium D3-12]|nr:hypothetical protein N4R57_17675 [Rhodobacteraceae bacterium D3-12]
MTHILDLRACRFHALYSLLTGAACQERPGLQRAGRRADLCHYEPNDTQPGER